MTCPECWEPDVFCECDRCEVCRRPDPDGSCPCYDDLPDWPEDVIIDG
jgi:hypothetical protein